MRDIIFTGIFFDFTDGERADLITVAEAEGMPNTFLHHVTLAFRPHLEGEHVRNVLKHEGRKIRVTVTSLGVGDGVVAFGVEPDPIRMSEFGLECANKTPHLTVATAEGVKPFAANKAIFSPRSAGALTFTGKVGAFRGGQG
jgi:hypothetical protein